jgi:hypothetical protein
VLFQLRTDAVGWSGEKVAFITHVRRREAQGIVVTLVLLALAAFVVWGRFGPRSFTG